MAKNGLVYAALWERGKILMQYMVEENDTLSQIARSLFERIDLSYDHRKSFAAHQGYTFQYIVEDEHSFLCAAVDGFPQRICFAFLDRFKTEFFDKYLGSSHISSSFRDWTKNEIQVFNSNPDADKLRGLKNQVGEVTDTMKNNMQRVLERGDRLEDLDGRALALNDTALHFHDETKRLKCELCKNNAKLVIIISIVSVVLVGVLILVIALFFGLNGGSGDGDTKSTTTLATTTTTTTTLAALL